jgi:hypothetical protein
MDPLIILNNVFFFPILIIFFLFVFPLICIISKVLKDGHVINYASILQNQKLIEFENRNFKDFFFFVNQIGINELSLSIILGC